MAALRSGQLDSIEYNLTATQYNSLKGHKNIAVYPQVSGTWTAIELNPGAQTRSGRHFGNGNPALTDPRVRQAIEMAINKHELVSKVMGGPGGTRRRLTCRPPTRSSGGPRLPPSSSTTIPPRPTSCSTPAGYKMGPNGIRIDPKTHKPLVLRLGIHSDETTDAAMAPYIVEWLKAIGIQVTVQSMSFNELNSDLPKGDWDMLSDTWTVNPDPTYLLSIQTCGVLPLNNGTSGNTDAFFCNPQYDKLFTQQSTEFNTAQRVQTIDQMQQILYQNAVDVILYYPDWLSAIRTNVVKNYYYGQPNAQGFYPIPNEFINWRSATPVADSSSSSSSPAVWIIIVIVVVALLAGGGFSCAAGPRPGERE